MAGSRTRPIDEATARLRTQLARLGAEARISRMSLGWTQAQVARRARTSQASVSRFERGDIHVTAMLVASVLAAVGLDLSMRTFPNGGVRLRDSGQLRLAGQLRAAAHSSWRVMFEAPAGDSGQAADVLLLKAAAGIHVELESNLVDVQAQLRSGQLKRDALQREHGVPVAFVLALRDTELNRAAVRAHQGVIRTALPAGSREVLGAIRDGWPLPRDGLVWLRQRPVRREVSD